MGDVERDVQAQPAAGLEHAVQLATPRLHPAQVFLIGGVVARRAVVFAQVVRRAGDDGINGAIRQSAQDCERIPFEDNIARRHGVASAARRPTTSL